MFLIGLMVIHAHGTIPICGKIIENFIFFSVCGFFWIGTNMSHGVYTLFWTSFRKQRVRVFFGHLLMYNILVIITYHIYYSILR